MAAAQAAQEIGGAAGWLTVGILGGSGDQGRGLVCSVATAGIRLIIGSRNPGRAEAAAAEIGSPPQVTGVANEDAASTADLVIAAVPWEGHADLLAQPGGPLGGKIRA